MIRKVNRDVSDVHPDASHPMDRPARFAASLSDFWNYPALRHTAVRVCLALVVLGYCLARARIGLAGSEILSHDAFYVLDGAWRMMNDQRPHTDFSSMIGFLAYAPTVVGLWISGGRVQGFGYGQGLAGIVLSVWAYMLGRRRLLDVPLLLMCVAIAFTAAAPFALGSTPLMISPGMTYNRYGYDLLALLLIEALADDRNKHEHRDFIGGLSTGAIIAILFFLKITFFVASLFLLVTLLPCRVQTKARWKGIGVGFVAMSIACSSYYGFKLMPIFDDLTLMANAKHIPFTAYIVDNILEHAAVLFAFSVAAAFLVSSYGLVESAKKIYFAGGAVAICGVLVIFGSYEHYGFPLAVFFALVVLNSVTTKLLSIRRSGDFFSGAVFLLGSVIVAASLFSSTLGMCSGLFNRLLIAPHFPPMDSARLYGFVPVSGDEWYGGMVNDGISLINKLRRDHETIMCLDFTNPFAYGLGIKPARGGTSGLQFNSSFNDKYHQSPEELFGAADLVIVPKGFTDPSLQQSIPRIYGAYLASHYSFLGDSVAWRLYRRNDQSPPAPAL